MPPDDAGPSYDEWLAFGGDPAPAAEPPTADEVAAALEAAGCGADPFA